MKKFLELIRVKHWVKNFFVLTPLFFSQQALNDSLWLPFTLAFLGFCFLSSSVYVLNDWLDRDTDALHPHKKDRPVTSGKIKATEAHLVFGVCLTLFWLFSLFLPFPFFIWGMIYFFINVLYSIGLKKIPPIDAIIIISGFIIRVYAGGSVAGIPISSWLILISVELSMLLVFGKRKGDLLFSDSKKIKGFSGVYSVRALDLIIAFSCISLFLSYTFYTLSPDAESRAHSVYFFLTALPVAAGLARYLFIVFRSKKNTDPVALLFTDHLLQLFIVLWAILVSIFIYINNPNIG